MIKLFNNYFHPLVTSIKTSKKTSRSSGFCPETTATTEGTFNQLIIRINKRIRH